MPSDRLLKELETTELCFIVVGLLAHMYMWSPNPKFCCSVSKWDFWRLGENVPVGKTVALMHDEDSFTATLLVFDLKMVTFPVCALSARARWERFRPEPAPMWMLCTVATL